MLTRIPCLAREMCQNGTQNLSPTLRVTLLTLAHLPCFHLPHFTHNTEFAVTRFPQMPHGSILRTVTSPSAPLTNTFVFPRFTFSPLLSNASFYFQNFSLSPSIISLIRTKSSAYNISLIEPLLTLSVTTSTTIAKTKGDNMDPWSTPTFTSILYLTFIFCRPVLLV